ncbi:MAG: hypothetical protein UY96_C0010G0046 [Parcubacteria group bacterium GW2011_GWB1_56_8]|nr:MAG: hypothetical protein UY96_C0010G0046 [Parcubacteria group bacterium GW2011_GWB1_56_8]
MIEQEQDYCWRCGGLLSVGRPFLLFGYVEEPIDVHNGEAIVGLCGDGNVNYGGRNGDGCSWKAGGWSGNGRRDGPLPLCDDLLACACRQAVRPV